MTMANMAAAAATAPLWATRAAAPLVAEAGSAPVPVGEPVPVAVPEAVSEAEPVAEPVGKLGGMVCLPSLELAAPVETAVP